MRAIIIDDEDLARANLRMMLQEYAPDVEVVGMADGKDNGLKVIKEMTPDVVFLDIRMPSGEEGFDLLRELEEINFLVIFVTAFKDFAIDAFKVNAVDYILKPIDIEELESAVERLRGHLALLETAPEKRAEYTARLRSLAELSGREEARISISHLGGVKVVKQRDILHLEADGNCTRIHFSNGGEYLDTRTLKVYEEELESDYFFRTHKSHIVNIRELNEYSRSDGHFAVLSNNIRVPISRQRLSSFLERLRSL